MVKFECNICAYVYDEEVGVPDGKIPPGTKWDELPDDWTCPVCGAPKDDFTEK